MRVSQEEAKIYEGFLANRGQYETEEQMTTNYKKRIAKFRERKLLAQQLAEAKNRIAVKKEDNEATKNEEA